MNEVILVAGEKQNPDGSIHREYVDRLERARTLSRIYPDAVVVLTGGATREGHPSEALQASKVFLEMCEGNPPWTYLDQDSRTTSGNIVHAQTILRENDITPRKLIIIARKSAIPKIRVLIARLWTLGTPEIVCVAGMDTKPVWYRLVDRTAMVVLSCVDPADRWSLWVLRKLARNG